MQAAQVGTGEGEVVVEGLTTGLEDEVVVGATGIEEDVGVGEATGVELEEELEVSGVELTKVEEQSVVVVELDELLLLLLLLTTGTFSSVYPSDPVMTIWNCSWYEP